MQLNAILSQQVYLKECFAVLPFCIDILPDLGVGVVHLGDEDVEEEDDGDALVHGPQGEAHHVRELEREHLGGVEVFLRLDPSTRAFAVKNHPEHPVKNSPHAGVILDSLVIVAEGGVAVCPGLPTSSLGERFVHEPEADAKSQVDHKEYKKDVDNIPDDPNHGDHVGSNGTVKKEPANSAKEVHGGTISNKCVSNVHWVISWHISPNVMTLVH